MTDGGGNECFEGGRAIRDGMVRAAIVFTDRTGAADIVFAPLNDAAL